MGIYWKNIDPQLEILGNLQQINFSALQNLSKFQFNNSFAPTSLIPSRHFLEFRNNTLSGFRFCHTTAFGDTNGSLKLQSFVNAEDTGIDILEFLGNGSLNFPAPVSFSSLSITGDLDLTNHKIINLADPVDPQDAATKAFVLSVAGSGTVTLTGAVTGSGTGTINTTLSPITTSQITNFSSAVTAFRLDEFAAPTSELNLNNQVISNLQNPFLGSHAATKDYVDTSIGSYIITLTGAVTGSGTGTVVTTLSPITVSQITDFYTAATGLHLNEFSPPLSPVSFGNQRITDLDAPVIGTDGTNKDYVDTAISTIDTSVTLTGAVTGSGTGTIATVLTPFNTSKITDFIPAVLSFRLDEFQPPNFNINMNSRRLINMPDPIAGTDGANKYYVDTRTLTLTGAVTGTGSLGPASPGFPGTNGIIVTTISPITTSLISDFSSSVTSFRLDQFAAPFTPVNLNGQRITNLGNPLVGTDGANRNYVDAAIAAASSITLTGSVTGSGSGTIDTAFASTQDINGATQTFIYDSGSALDSYFTLANQTVIPTGGIVATNIRLLNSTTSCGFNLHQETGATPTENRFFFMEFSDGGAQFDTIWSVNYNSVEDVFQMNFIRPVNFTNLVNFNNVVLNNVGLPILGTDGANRNYVDTAISTIDTSVTLTGAVTGSGTGIVPNLLNPVIDAQSETQQFNFNDTLDGFGRFRLKNLIGGSAKTQFEIADSANNIIMKIGSTKNYSPDYAFIETAGSPFGLFVFPYCAYSIDTNARMIVNPNGFVPLSSAQLEVNGGVQNVAGEATVIRASSSTLSTKIELENKTAGTGRNYELRSNSDGTFAIVDRNTSSERININPVDGSVNMYTYFGLRPAASIKLYNGSAATVLSAANVYAKVANTTTQEYALYFTTSNNRITYTGTPNISARVSVSMVFYASQNGRYITAAIFKNGAIVSSSRCDGYVFATIPNSVPAGASFDSTILMTTNDYLEIFVANNVGPVSVFVRQMSFSVTAT